MTTLGIVEVVDVVCNGNTRRQLRGVPVVVKVFTFEKREEGLCYSVVPAIAGAAPARRHPKSAQPLCV